MTEVEKHYGLAEDAPNRPAARGGGKADSDDGLATRVTSVKDQAARAAGSARETVGGAYGQARDWANDSYEAVSRNARYARRKTAVQAGRGRQQVESFVDENPVVIGLAGLAVGLLVGALLPGTRREDQYFGRYADEVRAQGIRYAQDAVEQGRHILEENVGKVQEAAREVRTSSSAAGT